MSNRSFGDYLLLSGVLDNVPRNSIPVIARFSDYVLNPQVKIVENDCGTQLGSIEPLDDNVIGSLELLTDTAIDAARLDVLKASGKKSVSIRTLPTCTSVGGVCQKCYNATHNTTPALDSVVKITPSTALPFYRYLADTYSGSLIGVQALPADPLPIRKSLIDAYLVNQYIDYAYVELSSKCPNLPADLLSYCEGISDKLEKSLFIIFLYCVYCPEKLQILSGSAASSLTAMSQSSLGTVAAASSGGFSPSLELADNGITTSFSDNDTTITITDWGTGSEYYAAASNIQSTGKRYIEYRILNGDNGNNRLTFQLLKAGLMPSSTLVGDGSPKTEGFRFESRDGSNGLIRSVYENDQMLTTSTTQVVGSTGDVVSFAIDFDALTVEVRVNDSLIYTSQDFGLGDAFGPLQPTIKLTNNSVLWSVRIQEITANLTYSPPSGYTPWGE